MKKRGKIATLRRLVALAMLSTLLLTNTAVYAETSTEEGVDKSVDVKEDMEMSDTGEVVNSGDDGDIRGELDSNNLEITGSGEEFTAKLITENKIQDDEAGGEPGNQPIVTLGGDDPAGDDPEVEEPEDPPCEHDVDENSEPTYVQTESGHDVYKQCKLCEEGVKVASEECTMSENGRRYEDKANDATHHYVIGTCKYCGKQMKVEEECTFIHSTNKKYRECTKCSNFEDNRNHTPNIDVMISTVDDKEVKNPITLKNTNNNINYTVFDQQTKLTFKIFCEALEDEAEQYWTKDMQVKLNVFDSKGKNEVTLTYKAFDSEKHIATYEYVTPEKISSPITVSSIEAKYLPTFNLLGFRIPEYFSGGSMEKDLHYIVRNVDADEHINKLAEKSITGGNWTKDDEHVWYSKEIDGHADKLTVTLNGVLGNEISNPVLVENEGSDEEIMVKGEEPVINNIWTSYTAGLFKEEYTVSYLNELQFNVPADIRDGEHVFTLKATICGKEVELNENIHIFIDNTVPEIKDIKYNSDATKLNDKYYNKDVEIQVVASDEQAFDYVASKLFVTGHEGEVFFNPNEDKALASVLITEETAHELSGKIFDQAGNSVEIEKQPEFIIDKTSPELKVNFDNHDAKHEKYYKADRKATFVFTDINIDGNEAKMANVSYTAAEGTPTIGEMSGENGSYTGTMLFDKDGVYKLGAIESYKFVDKAGNPVELKEGSDSDYSAEFVIDKTAPTISISFDNNSYQNEMYYKDSRTAEITFTEKNFAKEQVTINKNSDDLDRVPALSTYTDSDSKHVTRIVFDQDGRYGFTVGCEDLAGNLANTVASNNFVIDRTVPELEITGVTHMSANNGAVVPVITSKDLNINEYSTEIQLTGSNNGTMHPAIDKKLGTGNCVYTISDLAHEKSNDDLYKLSVKLKDFAGNEVTKEVTYSINRFGSVFVLGDATKAMVDGYYVTNPQNVVITEINVDSLTKKDVSLACDGDVKNLREGSDYQSSDVTNERGWHSISYNVPSANFRKDGLYAVTIFSEDRASNRQSNQSKDAEVNFLVDQTAPSVIVSGIEDGGVYEEESHDFSVNVTDTIGVTGMTVYLNGDKLASYSQSELNENGGTAVLTMPSNDDYQSVTIECSDVAGNKANLAFNNILVSVKAEELLVEKEVEQSAGIPGLTSAGDAVAAAIDMKKVVPVVIAIAVIAVFAGAGVIVVNRKRNK